MDERNWGRHLVEKEVPCEVAGRKTRAFLYDLSAGGCMVELVDARDVIGQPVAVELHRYQAVTGDIVWQSGCCVGVRFGMPLDEAIVRRVGFTPPVTPFDQQAPHDRLGRTLATVDTGSGHRPAL